MRFFVFLFITVFSFFHHASSADTRNEKLSTSAFEANYLDKSCFLFSETKEGTNEPVKGNLAAKYIRPMTARVVECLDGTMSSLFLGTNPETGFTLFQEFQAILKPLVILVLVLYLMLNGYLIMTGQMLREKPTQEILMFLLKFVLVFYFAVGDAWKDFFFTGLRSISFTFGSILVEAGASTLADGCIFTGEGAAPYPSGKSYIAMFDAIDCKFGNYLGWFADKKFPILIPIAIMGFFTAGVGPIIFGLAFTLAIQLISLAARVTQLYLVSVMVLTVLIYASPLIVPLVLFKQTKGIFDSWLQQIIGLIVHPIMVFAIAGIMLSITDRIYYGSSPDELFLTPKHQFKYTETQGVAQLQFNLQKLVQEMKDASSSDINKIKTEINNLAKVQLEQIEKQSQEIKAQYACKTQNVSVSQCSPENKYFICEDSKKQAECSLLNSAYVSYIKLLSLSKKTTLDQILEELSSKEGITTLLFFAVPGIGAPLALMSTAAKVAQDLITHITGSWSKDMLINPNAVPGAKVNPKCYGGIDQSFGIFSTGIPSLVCVMAWLDRGSVTVGLPIPYFIEIIDIYLPYRIDIFILFLVVVLICIILNFLVGTVFEKIESLIESISGVQVSAMGSYMGMESAIKTGMQGAQTMGNEQDKVFKRAKGAEGGNANDNKAESGGANDNKASAVGSGANDNKASAVGSGTNDNKASAGGGEASAGATGGGESGANDNKASAGGGEASANDNKASAGGSDGASTPSGG